MRITRGLAFVSAVGGMTAICLAWWSPSGLWHTNDTTCSLEPCQRFCRVCCTHFNPDVTSPGWWACAGTCATLPTNCTEPEEPGDPQYP